MAALPIPPLYSTFTLFTEIVITLAILYTFYSGYVKNHFPKKIAFGALIYETFFNVSYMVMRVLTHKEKPHIPDPDVWLAAFHGITSLIMFILLIVFVLLAWKNYKKGINYFKEHKKITFLFLFFWMISIFSGIAFYILEYFVTG